MEEKQSKVQKAKQYISKNKILCAIIACLVVVILAMSGTVSSAENQREMILNQLQVQTEQYEKLQSNFDNLSAQYDDINGAYATVKAELVNYQDQQETIDTLNTQLTEAQENYDTLSTENEKLKEQIAELKNSSGGGGGAGGGTLFSSNLSGESSGTMVWIPASGEKYHSIPDCGNMNPNKAEQVSKSSAEAMGYDACSKCW